MASPFASIICPPNFRTTFFEENYVDERIAAIKKLDKIVLVDRAGLAAARVDLADANV